MKRTLIISSLVIIILMVSFGYFFFLRGTSSRDHALAEETETTSLAERSEKKIAAVGRVESVSEEIEVGAEIPGKLKEVPVEEGEEVFKGQILAVLENEDLEAAVRSAKTGIAALEAQKETLRARIDQAVAEKTRVVRGARPEERREALMAAEQTEPVLETAVREAERRRKLFADGDISREDLERAEREVRVARAKNKESRERYNLVNAPARTEDVERADAVIRLNQSQIGEIDARIRQTRAQIFEAEARLEKTFVRAPISGIVVRKRLKSGESFSPENPNGIVTLADLSVLRVRVDIDETDVAKIREGQKAYVTADAYADQKFTGRIVRIGRILGRKNVRTDEPAEKNDTKILETLVELDPGQKLPLGLRVDAFVLID
ncbi:MAG: efflux RND transporter periplasmic adaptor subunit [Pyrinomonadaceae bacterium]